MIMRTVPGECFYFAVDIGIIVCHGLLARRMPVGTGLVNGNGFVQSIVVVLKLGMRILIRGLAEGG